METSNTKRKKKQSSAWLAFVKKEFHHILRDKRTMLILLVMPVVEILLFGFAISNEVKNVKVGVLDPSNDVLTRQLIDRIDASEYFTVTYILSTPHQMDEMFRLGKIDMALVFSTTFADNIYTGESAIQLIADATDPNMASMQTNYAMGVLRSMQQELTAGMASVGGGNLVPDIKLLYNPQMKSSYFFVPGVMGIILMLICAMMTSISIVREKETGTMEVLLVSPVRPIMMILAKAVPYFALSCVNLVTILLLSVYLLGVPITGSLFWLIVVSLLFIFVALALGVFISSIAKTQVVAMLASGLILMMPTVLLSGMIFPTESMHVVLQWISAVLPVRWYISLVKQIMIQGVDIRFLLPEIGILLFMGLVLVVASLKKFKNRIE